MASRALIQSAIIVTSLAHETIAANDANSPVVVVVAKLDPYPGGGIDIATLKLQCDIYKLGADGTTGTLLGSVPMVALPNDAGGRTRTATVAPAAHGLAAGGECAITAIVRLSADVTKLDTKTGQTVVQLSASAVKPAADVIRFKRLAA